MKITPILFLFNIILVIYLVLMQVLIDQNSVPVRPFLDPMSVVKQITADIQESGYEESDALTRIQNTVLVCNDRICTVENGNDLSFKFEPFIDIDLETRASQVELVFFDPIRKYVGYIPTMYEDGLAREKKLYVYDLSQNSETGLTQSIWLNLPNYSIEFDGYIQKKGLLVFTATDLHSRESSRFVYSVNTPSLEYLN